MDVVCRLNLFNFGSSYKVFGTQGEETFKFKSKCLTVQEMILVLYILIIVALILVFSFRNLINSFWYSLKIPGPPALPLLGNFLLFINKSPSG